MTQMMISKSFVHFAITHNISSSKGWGRDGAVYVPETNDACADCGSTGHNTGSDTCPGPNEQDRLEAM